MGNFLTAHGRRERNRERHGEMKYGEEKYGGCSEGSA